jgi:hypothetical protein
MYTGSFKPTIPGKRVILDLEMDKNSTHFQLGFEETEYYRSSDSMQVLDVGAGGGVDARDTAEEIKAKFKKTYVLNSPDKVDLDYKSTMRCDFERLSGQRGVGSNTASNISTRSRGSNISIGDGPFTSIGSEYAMHYDPATLSLATMAQSTSKEGRGCSVSLKDDVAPVEKLQSWSQSDYKAHPIIKSENAQELKKSNNKSSITLGSVETFEVPTTKSDYQKLPYSKADAISAKRLLYDPISMQDALPIGPRELPCPISSDYATHGVDERIKCYNDSKSTSDNLLIQEKKHSLRYSER